jgi:hypothetical protein
MFSSPTPHLLASSRLFVEWGPLLITLNYSLLSWVILCNILEMADMETPINRATPTKTSYLSYIDLGFCLCCKIPQALHKVLQMLLDSGITASIA